VHSLHLSKGGRELAGTHAGLAPQVSGAAGAVRMQPLPDRRLQLSWDAGRYPVIMLRDSRTGEVRGFLRGGSAQVQDVPEDVEVHFSDGVRSDMIRYRRQAE